MQQSAKQTGRKTSNVSTQDRIDLTMLFMSDLRIGKSSILQIKERNRPFWVRYSVDGGRIREQTFLSVLSWRALMLQVLKHGSTVDVLDMDEPGQFNCSFPPIIRQQLEVNVGPSDAVVPVLRLQEDGGSRTVIITRSRCRGHAVDALHNLTDGGPVFQAIWISDLMRLNSKIGMKFIRDEAFAPSLPIRAYLEAAARLGKIVEEPALLTLPLTGSVVRLKQPETIPIVQRIFDQQCRENPELEAYRGRTVYDDYFLSGLAESM